MGSARKRTQRRPRAPDASAVAGTSREAQAALRREQLLGVALELFYEHGYAGTSTKKIAIAAGVVEGLVFHYFRTKEEILFALAARSTSFAGKALAVLVDAEGRSARELLLGIASAFGDVSEEERRFVGFMLAEAQVNRELGDRVHDAHSMAIASVVALLSKRVEVGELRRGASLEAATHGFLGGFVFFLGQHRHLHDNEWRREASRFAAEWADLCWRGLACSDM